MRCVERMRHRLAEAPMQQHPLASLLPGAWRRRPELRLADALSVELAVSLGVPLVTTDGRLHHVSAAEVVVA